MTAAVLAGFRINSGKSEGVTCHERPNLSLSQPQTCDFGSPT
jgi:hypothetical protein